MQKWEYKGLSTYYGVYASGSENISFVSDGEENLTEIVQLTGLNIYLKRVGELG